MLMPTTFYRQSEGSLETERAILANSKCPLVGHIRFGTQSQTDRGRPFVHAEAPVETYRWMADNGILIDFDPT